MVHVTPPSILARVWIARNEDTYCLQVKHCKILDICYVLTIIHRTNRTKKLTVSPLELLETVWPSLSLSRRSPLFFPGISLSVPSNHQKNQIRTGSNNLTLLWLVQINIFWISFLSFCYVYHHWKPRFLTCDAWTPNVSFFQILLIYVYSNTS